MVETVKDNSKADFWTFEYRDNSMVIIHPSERYDEALCIKNDGGGFYYKTGLGGELPTVELASLEPNCHFPMFGVEMFSHTDGEEATS